LILTWIYYSSIILLLGAEFTEAYAKHTGSLILPNSGAVRVVKEKRHIRNGEEVDETTEPVRSKARSNAGSRRV
jgi:membrane protein